MVVKIYFLKILLVAVYIYFLYCLFKKKEKIKKETNCKNAPVKSVLSVYGKQETVRGAICHVSKLVNETTD